MSKIVCDPIHGQIPLPSICVTIIDTPEFQRLRSIRQTGLLEYVYPGSTHNRFAHSLGVCYLAGVFLQHLQVLQPKLPITPVDILCVQIAGLCHDLGHGPFSHTWETFMRESCNLKNDNRTWKHEIVSLNMFEYLIEANDLSIQFEEHGIGRTEIDNIKMMIMGKKPENKEKTFLYQIVNNEDSGLDVDKWDYCLRDCHYTGLPCNFKYQRIMRFASVLPVNGRNVICFRDKVVGSIYNLFFNRSDLHRLAYQHRVHNIIETMFIDSLLKADEILMEPSGQKLLLWKWSMDAAFCQSNDLATAMKKFSILTDKLILSSLKYAIEPGLKDAQFLLTAIEKRSCEYGYYKQIAFRKSPIPLEKQEILAKMEKLLPESNQEVWNAQLKKLDDLQSLCNFQFVTIEDIAIKVISIHWGKKRKDPVTFVHFYTKDLPMQVEALNPSQLPVNLPKVFEEIEILVMCRRSDYFAVEVSKLLFEKYWQKYVQLIVLDQS